LTIVNIFFFFSFSVLSYWILFIWPNFHFLFQLGLSIFFIYTPCILLSNIQVNKNFMCFLFSVFLSFTLNHCLFSFAIRVYQNLPFIIVITCAPLKHHIKQGIFIFIDYVISNEEFWCASDLYFPLCYSWLSFLFSFKILIGFQNLLGNVYWKL